MGRCLLATTAMGIRWPGGGLVLVLLPFVVVVDFCQIGGLVTGGTVNGGDDEFGIDAAKTGVSLTSGKVPLEKTLGLRSARRGQQRWGGHGRLLMVEMGDGRWQMKQAIDRQIVAGAVAAGEGSRGSWRRSGYSHQQTRFSASTIADNDELSAEFCHFGGCGL